MKVWWGQSETEAWDGARRGSERVCTVRFNQGTGSIDRQAGLPPLMMVGDLTYDVHLFEHGHVPGVGNRRRLQEATAMVNKMRERMPDLVVLAAHDPSAADRLARATGHAPVPLAKAGP